MVAPADDGEVTAAAREAVATILARATAEDLRRALAQHDELEAARRERADAQRARLLQRLAEAEHADRVASARARLLADAEGHDREAARLAELADGLAARLAEADAELARQRAQRDELAASMRAAAEEAERLLTTDPERAGAIAAQNAGRQLALHGLDAHIGELELLRQAIASGADLPPEHPDGDDGGPHLFIGDVDSHARDLDGLRARVAFHRQQAAECRAQAEDDLGEAAAEQAAAMSDRLPRGGVLATHTALQERAGGPREPYDPAALGYPKGSLGAAIVTRPRRRR
jgi:hypothetical protein